MPPVRPLRFAAILFAAGDKVAQIQIRSDSAGGYRTLDVTGRGTSS